jgi:hypothetical protein
VTNPGLYICIVLIVLTCASWAFFLLRFYKLENKLDRILYYDYKGYDGKYMDPYDYFVDDAIKKPKGGKISDRNVDLEKTVIIKPSDMTPEGDNANVMKLKENDGINIVSTDRNELNVNNYLSNTIVKTDQYTYDEGKQVEKDIDINDLKDVKKPHSLRLATLLDYAELDPSDSLIYDKRNTKMFLKDKLILDHPILSLIWNKSIKEPLFLRILQLEFSFSLQFAINAMLYTDGYIDMRQEDSDSVCLSNNH